MFSFNEAFGHTFSILFGMPKRNRYFKNYLAIVQEVQDIFTLLLKLFIKTVERNI